MSEILKPSITLIFKLSDVSPRILEAETLMLKEPSIVDENSYIESCAISTPFVSHWISACVLLMILALNLIFCAGKIVFFKLKF